VDTADKKNKRCAACFREVVAKGKKYCIYHSQAYDSLQKQYNAWVHAYGGISKVDYLNKLLTLNQTGSWVKEIIGEELRMGYKKVEIVTMKKRSFRRSFKPIKRKKDRRKLNNLDNEE
jgi:hypothetical protein